ncbi:PPARGC1 and ESRR induced regulator, muscle 1 [Pitangus sulphuratus]|nr:PPARGC1 and ESRR induced regulator, muscle 1 [Pitangus sulphuratus]
MEPPGTPSTPEQGGDASGGQPLGGSPAPPARKRHPSASHSEPRPRGPPCDAPIPSLGAAQEEASGERAGAEQSSPAGSPSVVRPKVPGQQKKSRKQQRGAGTAEGDRDPGAAAAQGAAQGPGKAPPSSPVSSRKSKGKDKAAKAALVRLGSEEAAEAKQQVPGPGVHEGDPAGNAPPRQKGKEPGAQSPGKTKATKPSKAGQAGGLGVRDSAPPIPDNGAVAPSGEACQEMPRKPLQAKNMAAFGGDAAEGACGAPAAEIPGVPAAEIPGAPAAEIPGVPAVEISGVPAAEIPGATAVEIPGATAVEVPGATAVEIPGVPAFGIPEFPAAEIPSKPSEIPVVPSLEIPWEPAPEIPRKPSAGIPRSPAIEIPRKTAAEIPRIATPEIPWEPAPETPRKLSPPCFADGASARSNTLDVTWPEMYDYLFCDSQEEEEELGSSVEGRRSPLQREISWPELYEYFFNEPEGKRKKAKGKDRKRKKFGSLDHTGLQNEDPSSAPVKDTVIISVPEVCEHFFPERPKNRMGWRGIFSIAPASEVKRAVGALKSFLQRKRHPVGGEAPASQALVLRGSEEKFALVPLAPPGRGQVWPEGEDMALALRGTAEDPRVLTHKDMCLVFCAFASWAVKTSDLQAPDAWKTMFLASFGTLSAIRYFRRQVREGHPRT